MCVHSDDVDMVCECPQDGIVIADAFNTKFGGDDDGIKMCDPKFMLGVVCSFLCVTLHLQVRG